MIFLIWILINVFTTTNKHVEWFLKDHVTLNTGEKLKIAKKQNYQRQTFEQYGITQ